MRLEDAIKTKKFPDNIQKTLVNIMFTYSWLRDLQKHLFKEYKLQAQHYNILRIVRGKHPEAATPGHIKSVMIDKGPDTTRLVDKLVRMELLERCVSSSSRRCVEITMTEKGMIVTEEIKEKIEGLMRNNIHLSEEEAEQLNELLDKMRG